MAMFVYRTLHKNVLWEFESIIIENLRGDFLLIFTPTWPSHHTDAKQGYRCMSL